MIHDLRPPEFAQTYAFDGHWGHPQLYTLANLMGPGDQVIIQNNKSAGAVYDIVRGPTRVTKAGYRYEWVYAVKFNEEATNARQTEQDASADADGSDPGAARNVQ